MDIRTKLVGKRVTHPDKKELRNLLIKAGFINPTTLKEPYDYYYLDNSSRDMRALYGFADRDRVASPYRSFPDITYDEIFLMILCNEQHEELIDQEEVTLFKERVNKMYG